jgi:hypothetical protein
VFVVPVSTPDRVIFQDDFVVVIGHGVFVARLLMAG